MDQARSPKDVFNDALELPAGERGAFLDRVCAGNEGLRRKVEDLLAIFEDAPRFMAAPTASAGGGEAASAGAGAAVSEGPGSIIGRYKLLQLIGEGGFGSVFMAQQESPVQRRVALKIIKLGMDTRQVIARFEAERQALALMEHPNIARVFDAGATEAGRPYFVMELVRGEPLTDYCDRNQLSIDERLRLFAQVCQAVQHAHQKGVIHRDLKPSNVLVTSTDGQAIPKVIDFGIAKATSARLTEKTVFTEHRQLIGTPEYMSPEQAEMTSSDIDTRSDVYSLGVLLYELLTGALPFDARRLRSAAFAEIQRIIREEEPPTPSLRLSRLDALPSVAARRQIDPARLLRRVRGDLDWIVMKCLDKDRTRRYGTADALAQDILRHERGEPILAAPPSSAYRLRKFVRRHKVGVLAGAMIALLLVLAVAGTTTGMLWALREKSRADDAAKAESVARREAQQHAAQAAEAADLAQREARRAGEAEAAARQRAAELDQVASFQASQLSELDPALMGVRIRDAVVGQGRVLLAGRSATEAELDAAQREVERVLAGVSFTDVSLEALDASVLSRALEAIDQQFPDQPLLRARLLQATSDTLRELGLGDRAVAPQAEALDIRRRALGDGHPDTLASVNREGMLLQAQGKLREAEQRYREALDAGRREAGAEHPEVISALNNLGQVLVHQGRLAEAEPVCREALEQARRFLGEDHEGTYSAQGNLGLALNNLGRLSEAEECYRAALETKRRVLGDGHRSTLLSLSNLAVVLRERGRFDEAEPYFRETLEARRRLLGDNHPDTVTSINNLGGLLQYQGKLDEAEPFCRETLEQTRRLLGQDHPYTLIATNNMGLLLRTQGRLDEAEPFCREAVERMRRVLGDDHQNTIIAITNLGALLTTRGEPAAAEPLVREALDRQRRLLGEDKLATLDSMSNLGVVLRLQGKLEEAARLGAEAVERGRSVLRGHYVLGVFLTHYGRTLTAAGRHGDSQAALLEAHETLSRALGAAHRQTRDAARALAELYDAWHAAEPEAGHDARAAEWRSR
ncbi:MAG: serine/threonine-protein kinase [Phycisphaerae bacterium]|nr:serine/threonine protein kinase [Phycisphaerae bacterium]MCZ2398518.1 serine/threonine-protein kinase [Phycisphaerae bacterium]